MMRASGSFAVDLIFVLGELTIKGYDNGYLASNLLSLILLSSVVTLLPLVSYAKETCGLFLYRFIQKLKPLNIYILKFLLRFQVKIQFIDLCILY